MALPRARSRGQSASAAGSPHTTRLTAGQPWVAGFPEIERGRARSTGSRALAMVERRRPVPSRRHASAIRRRNPRVPSRENGRADAGGRNCPARPGLGAWPDASSIGLGGSKSVGTGTRADLRGRRTRRGGASGREACAVCRAGRLHEPPEPSRCHWLRRSW